MKSNKNGKYEWDQMKREEQFFYRLILFAIVTGFTGGVILVIELIRIFQALKDCIPN